MYKIFYLEFLLLFSLNIFANLKESVIYFKKTFKPKNDEHIFLIKDSNTNSNDDEYIDISSDYEHIDPNDPEYFYIPIFTTNDIHGYFYPHEIKEGGYNYTRGGGDYIAKYLSILRSEFGNRVLYFDAGDQFQGGTETNINNGAIITDYFNTMGLNLSAFGNHEFDYDRDYIEKRLNESNFLYLSANLYDNEKKTKKIYNKNNEVSTVNKIFDKEGIEIKIGVIGLSLIMEKTDVSGEGYENISFLEYKNELIKESKTLKNDFGVDAVLLLCHIGVTCGTENKTMELKMYDKDTIQEKCSEDTELYTLLNSINSSVIDAVITGHSHLESHHWINNIPIVAGIDSSYSANIIYLPFKKNENSKYILYKDGIKIEGPLPSCEKIFPSLRACPHLTQNEIENFLPLVNYKFHGILIEKDPILNEIHKTYDDIYNEYKEVICNFIGPIEGAGKNYDGDNIISNLVADIFNYKTGANIGIVGVGGIRSTLYPGEIQKIDIMNLLPFKNNICSFTLTGREIKHMMSIIQTGVKSYYGVSGVKQIISENEIKGKYLKNIVLYDGVYESEIIEDKEYSVSTTDFLFNGGDDFKNVITWFNPKDIDCNYGVMANVVIDFLRAQRILDGDKYYNPDSPRLRETVK